MRGRKRHSIEWEDLLLQVLLLLHCSTVSTDTARTRTMADRSRRNDNENEEEEDVEQLLQEAIEGDDAAVSIAGDENRLREVNCEYLILGVVSSVFNTLFSPV